MLVLILYAIIMLYVLYKNKVLTKFLTMDKYFILNIILICILFISHILEIKILSDTLFPFLDELNAFYYFPLSKSFNEIVTNIFDTYYIYYLIVKLALISTPPIVLKVINVFVLIIFMILLYKLSNNDNRVFKFFPIFLPYLYFLSFMNMRDMLIITTSLAFINEINNFCFKKLFLISFLALLIWMLRPMYLAILIVSMGFVIFLKGNSKLKTLSVIVILISIVAFKDFLMGQYNHFIYAIYLGNMEKNVEMLNFGKEITPFSYAVAFVKMFTTPIPTSKLKQIFFSEMSENFYLIELSRIIMHGAFYYLQFFTLLRVKSFITWIRQNYFNTVLTLMAFANSIIYAFYRMGSGSSRNKLWPIILLFLFFIYAKQYHIKSKLKIGRIYL